MRKFILNYLSVHVILSLFFYFFSLTGALNAIIYYCKQYGYKENHIIIFKHTLEIVSTPFYVLGGYLGDSKLGRYRSVLIFFPLSILAHFLNFVSSLSRKNFFLSFISYLLQYATRGLLSGSFIAFGTDQLINKSEESVNEYFSLLYLMNNAAAFLAISVTPIFRNSYSCIDHECYTLGFVVILATSFLGYVLFIARHTRYTKASTTSSVLVQSIKQCSFNKLDKKARFNPNPTSPSPYYAHRSETRKFWWLLSVCLPITIFLVLFNVMFSMWTIQASKMNGNIFRDYIIAGDQMNSLNTLLILTLIPLFNKIIYPISNKYRIISTPLKRMCLGIFFITLGTLSCYFVQTTIEEEQYSTQIPQFEPKFQIINLHPRDSQCFISTHLNRNEDLTHPMHFSKMYPYDTNMKVYSNHCSKDGDRMSPIHIPRLEKNNFLRIFILNEGDKLHSHYQMLNSSEIYNKNETGVYLMTVLLGELSNLEFSVKLERNNYQDTFTIDQRVTDVFKKSQLKKLEPQKYILKCHNMTYNCTANVAFDSHGLSSLIIVPTIAKGQPNDLSLDILSLSYKMNTRISILWQLPQYILVTIGEVLTLVIGVQFIHNESPALQKSIAQAMWRLPSGLSHIIIVLITLLASSTKTSKINLMLTILGFLSLIWFSIVAYLYRRKFPIA